MNFLIFYSVCDREVAFQLRYQLVSVNDSI